MNEVSAEYLSVSKVCLLLEISTATVKRWYKWWENDNFPKPAGIPPLPSYVYRDRRKTKFFHKKDLPLFSAFEEALRGPYKGCMAEFNAAYQWGKKGETYLNKRDSSSYIVKQRMR